MPPLPIRPRRLRRSEAIRSLVREHHLAPEHVLIEMPNSVATPFGGAWLTLAGDAGAAIDAVPAARKAVGEGVLAVDLRSFGRDIPELACRLHMEGTDLLAVHGPDTAPVREALESAGAVHAVLVACATFPLDMPGQALQPFEDGMDWVVAGADMILIEPCLPNLDRIRAAREALPVPVMARITPEEQASYDAAFERGWLDGGKIPAEALVSVRRAGARVVVIPAGWAAQVTAVQA